MIIYYTKKLNLLNLYKFKIYLYRIILNKNIFINYKIYFTNIYINNNNLLNYYISYLNSFEKLLKYKYLNKYINIYNIYYKNNIYYKTLLYSQNTYNINLIFKILLQQIIHKNNLPINCNFTPFNNFKYIKTPKYKEINFQLKVNNKYNLKSSLNLYLLKYNMLFNFNTIDNIFEILEFNLYNTFISSSISILQNISKYNTYIEIYLIDILNINNNYKLFNNINLKIPNNLLPSYISYGGNNLIYGSFSPKKIMNLYYKSLSIFSTLYKSIKSTSIFIFNIILESLITQFQYQGIILPSVFFEIIVTRLVSNVKILNSGNTILNTGDIINITLINIINNSYIKHGYEGIYYKPILLGLTRSALINSGILSTISFQETIFSLSQYILNIKLDWLLDLKSKIITSELLESGSGWYKRFVK